MTTPDPGSEEVYNCWITHDGLRKEKYNLQRKVYTKTLKVNVNGEVCINKFHFIFILNPKSISVSTSDIKTVLHYVVCQNSKKGIVRENITFTAIKPNQILSAFQRAVINYATRNEVLLKPIYSVKK